MSEHIMCHKRQSEYNSKGAFTILRASEPPEGMVRLGETPGGVPTYCYPEDLEYFQNRKEGGL